VTEHHTHERQGPRSCLVGGRVRDPLTQVVGATPQPRLSRHWLAHGSTSSSDGWRNSPTGGCAASVPQCPRSSTPSRYGPSTGERQPQAVVWRRRGRQGESKRSAEAGPHSPESKPRWVT